MPIRRAIAEIFTPGRHASSTAPSLNSSDQKRRNCRGGPSQAYSESKLHVAALAAVVARRWQEVFTASVDPGWVPTKMGGSGAPDDLEMAHQTQAWLAAGEDATKQSSAAYWYHGHGQAAVSVTDEGFQDGLIEKLEKLTSISLSH